MFKNKKNVLIVVFVVFISLILVYLCAVPLLMTSYYTSRLNSELPRIQQVLDKQCVQKATASGTGFKVDDTGTTWSGENQNGLKISCRLQEFSNEWECSC